MQRQQARELLDRYLEGSASATEQNLVHAWYERIAKQRSLGADQEFDHLQDELWAGSRSRAGLGAPKSLGVSKKRISLWPAIAAAAILLAILSVSILFWTTHQSERHTSQQVADILPGGNRATLTLADGRTIDLSETQAGIIVGNGIKYIDGSAIVGPEAGSGNRPTNPAELENLSTKHCVLHTPRGGTYQITLSDGSKVWLNAASTLKYSSHFGDKERLVEVTGEAYFSVVPDVNRPFKVRSQGQEIRVVGTEFNLSAYPDESDARTTLVKGAVQIINRQSKIVHKLVPGEQAIIRDASTDIRAVKTQPFTAWKEGAFVFGAKPFTATMRDVARWYDIEVIYQTQQSPDNIRIGGWVAREKPLSSVIQLLKMTGTIHIRLTGRRLIIMD